VCPADTCEQFGSLEALFALERDDSQLAAHYRDHIEQAVDGHEGRSGAHLAACLLEPVLQGAGGMVFVDPLFQRVLVAVRVGWVAAVHDAPQ